MARSKLGEIVGRGNVNKRWLANEIWRLNQENAQARYAIIDKLAPCAVLARRRIHHLLEIRRLPALNEMA